MFERSVEKRRAQTREHLVATAHRLLVEKGVDGVSLRGVAAQLEYSPASLYSYFESKEALIDAVRARCLDRLNEDILAAVAGASTAREQLFLGGLAYLTFARAHPVDYQLMFGLGPSPATQGESHRTARRALLMIVEGGVERGELLTGPGYGAEVIAHHCWASVHGLAMLQGTVEADQASRLDALHREILSRVIRGFTTSSEEVST